MYLKNEFVQCPFSSKKAFRITYSDEIDLRKGILKLCKYLRKGTFLCQVFSVDMLNEVLSLHSNSFLNYKNFNYYLVEDLEFLNDLSFERLRFLNIYSINKNVSSMNLKQLKEIEKNYAFQLGFDNYLEEVEIIIEFNYYDSKTGEAVFVEQLESYINNNS